MRALVPRNPPSELSGEPKKEAPALAFLHVADALVDRPFRRYLYRPRVRLVGCQKRMQLTVDDLAFCLVELAPALFHQPVGLRIRVEDQVLAARRKLRRMKQVELIRIGIQIPV